MGVDAMNNNYHLALDEYGKQKVLIRKEALVDMIIMLIVGSEYQFGYIPKKTGFNIRNYRFRFIDEAIPEIQQGIKELVEANIPGSLLQEVAVVKQSNDTIIIGLEFLSEIIGVDSNQESEIEDRMALVRLQEREDGYTIDTI